jgi:rRNA-processing protein FCF1
MLLFKTKTRVIIDTNFLMIPGEFGVDIFSEIQSLMTEPYELCVLDKSVEELNKIIEKGSRKKEGFNAKLGLILIKQKNLKTLSSSSEGYADKAIIDLAKKAPEKTVVATQDKELRLKLAEIDVRTIQLRQQKHLILG